MNVTRGSFRIKICGVTSVRDAQMVADAGADAIGLNFYEKSPRYASEKTAKRIVNALDQSLTNVGVFVNADPEKVVRTFHEVGLDYVQLHGDETPESLTCLAQLPIIKAFRLRDDGLEDVVHYLDRCGPLGVVPTHLLLDAFDKDQYGGTGQRLDWNDLQLQLPQIGGRQWILAGGLNPANVAESIKQLQPTAVDTASGVETGPGSKDLDLTVEFVKAARAAFNKLM